MERELLDEFLPILLRSLIAYIIVFLAIVADLFSGIRKARKSGVKVTHTFGIDRTLDKLRKRYNLLVCFSFIDVIIELSEIHNTGIPYSTLAGCLIMCLVEIKSIYENDEDKGRYIEAAKTAEKMWKGINKDELAKIIVDKLNENRKSNESSEVEKQD